MINYRLKIDFCDSKTLASDICFVSGDVKSSVLHFEFYNDGKRVDISGYTLSVRARRSDGVVIASAGKIENNTAIFTPESNFYAVPGELYMEIALSDSSGKYATTKIITAEVIEGLGEAAINGLDNLNVYVKLLNEAVVAKDAAIAAAQRIENTIVDKPGQKVSGGGEIFNDYENNIASGEFSTAAGHQSIILNNVSISEQKITYISYADNVLTLSADGDFFDTADLWGFRIFNINTDEISDSTLNQSDVVKVKKSTKDTTADNWQFEIETPINSLNLNNPNNILILAILNDNEIYNTGEFSYVEGWGNLVLGNGIHAEGIHNIAEGETLHVEGAVNKVSGKFSHAEGANTVINGNYSHTEGFNTQASGSFTHAEGHSSKATKTGAHAEGYASKASAKYSHAEGYYTNAAGDYSHVQGKYNEIDEEGKYAHIVGGGTSDTKRKNIHTLDWNGNACFAGNITFKYNGNAYNIGQALEKLESLNLVDGNEVAY